MNVCNNTGAKVAIALAIALVTATGEAGTINDLYNTGVDNSHVTLPTAATDPHYYVVSDSTSAVVVDDSGYPFPAWVANVNGAGGSKWVSTVPDAYGRIGSFLYRTTFTIPSYADLSSVVVGGLWATDDGNSDILINGASTGQSSIGHAALTPFTVTTNFTHGVNTLDFVFDNVVGPTGLRIDGIRGTFVPEPSGVVAGIAGLGAIGSLRRRR